MAGTVPHGAGSERPPSRHAHGGSRCAVRVAVPTRVPAGAPTGAPTGAPVETLARPPDEPRPQASPTRLARAPAAGSAQSRAAADLHRRLLARAAGHRNDHAFACMIASRCTATGALPDWLGLDPAAFHCLMNYHFPRIDVSSLPGVGVADHASSPTRADEQSELLALLLMDRAGESPSEVWMAHVVAAGCLGSNHLWEDLGLWERPELTALMRRNFPALAARNVRDMKWKRFLYKQLCEAEGIYTCRAPSCEVCTDYHECFGHAP